MANQYANQVSRNVGELGFVDMTGNTVFTITVFKVSTALSPDPIERTGRTATGGAKAFRLGNVSGGGTESGKLKVQYMPFPADMRFVPGFLTWTISGQPGNTVQFPVLVTNFSVTRSSENDTSPNASLTWIPNGPYIEGSNPAWYPDPQGTLPVEETHAGLAKFLDPWGLTSSAQQRFDFPAVGNTDAAEVAAMQRQFGTLSAPMSGLKLVGGTLTKTDIAGAALAARWGTRSSSDEQMMGNTSVRDDNDLLQVECEYALVDTVPPLTAYLVRSATASGTSASENTTIVVSSTGAVYLPAHVTPVLNMGLASLSVTNPGSFYASTTALIFVAQPTNTGSGAAATLSISDIVLDHLKVSASGQGYDATTTLTISGGGGSAATATPTVSGGQVTDASVVLPGTGFSGTPTVTVNNTNGGFGAQVFAYIFGGTISASGGVTAGSGYNAPPIPVLTLTGSGSGFVASITMTGTVTGVNITNHGLYQWPPTASMSAATGTVGLVTQKVVRQTVTYRQLNDGHVLNIGHYGLRTTKEAVQFDESYMQTDASSPVVNSTGRTTSVFLTTGGPPATPTAPTGTKLVSTHQMTINEFMSKISWSFGPKTDLDSILYAGEKSERSLIGPDTTQTRAAVANSGTADAIANTYFAAFQAQTGSISMGVTKQNDNVGIIDYKYANFGKVLIGMTLRNPRAVMGVLQSGTVNVYIGQVKNRGGSYWVNATPTISTKPITLFSIQQTLYGTTVPDQASLVGEVNNATFLGLAAGTVMYLGADYKTRYDLSGNRAFFMMYNFVSDPNGQFELSGAVNQFTTATPMTANTWTSATYLGWNVTLPTQGDFSVFA